ncbi:MAG: DNA polymerase III subunit epsilon [Legionella sp.]
MRQIVLDTETTGIGHEFGHRIIEIGCVELIDRKITGNHFHVYLNPERKVDEGAFRVHGISDEFLQDKPLFIDIIKDFIEFIQGAELIIHNAPFDVGFLEAELKYARWPTALHQHCSVLDTLILAREKHPGQRNSLDALCKRYEVDNSNRKFHGALLDAEILAWVYLAMTGGQGHLFLDEQILSEKSIAANLPSSDASSLSTPVISATSAEITKHRELISCIVEKSGINHWENS